MEALGILFAVLLLMVAFFGALVFVIERIAR